MKKSTLILLICSIVAAVGLVVFLLVKNNVFSSKVEFSQTVFSVADSAQVNKVFIADMAGNSVLLKRGDKGWSMDDGTAISPEMLKSMLATLVNIRADSPVPEHQRENLNRVMATTAIKVEVYENEPKFTLFGHKFFVKERRTKTIYFGPETPDHMGNYAILEGMEDIPCVLKLPGFRGIITPRFSAMKQDWISHQMLSTKPTRIQELNVFDCRNVEESFTVKKADERHYDLYDYNGARVALYDTTKVFNLLAEFRDKKFQSIAFGMEQDKIDHILKNNLFKVITMTDVKGEKVELKCYYMDEEYDYYSESGDHLTDIEHLYNQDRFYAVLNGDTKTLYILQYYVFGRMVQTPFSKLVSPSVEK